jgi:hypothetical protein
MNRSEQRETDLAVVAMARRHADRKDLSIGAAKTLIRGLAAKVERYAGEQDSTGQPHSSVKPGKDEEEEGK